MEWDISGSVRSFSKGVPRNTTLKAAFALREMDEEDIRVLMGVELGMRKFKMVPINHVRFYSRLDREETEYRLDRVHKLGLLIRDNRRIPSYCLNYTGYDVLALHALYEKGVISSIGPPLGKGKESDVYRGITPDGKEVAVKFHRLGRTSFRNIRKFRSYIKDRRHISWLYIGRLSATYEYEALLRINGVKSAIGLDINIPEPYAQNRHCVVMGMIFGDELYRFDGLENPQKVFNEIIRQYMLIFANAHMVHADLGEFNILMDSDENIMIIDWPQWEDWNHPHAFDLLRRDIGNICSFFEKKYRFKADMDEIVADFIRIKEETIESVNYRTSDRYADRNGIV